MQPEHRDTYENGEVTLRIDHFTNPLENKYWVSGSVGSIQFTEEGFDNLVELIKEYDAEENPKKPTLRQDDPLQFWTIIIAAFVFAAWIVITMAY